MKSSLSVRRVVGVMLLVAALGACDVGGDDGPGDSNPDATLAAPETLPPVPVERTIPTGTLAGEDTAFVGSVVADGTVTADELASAYDGYIECLAAGGARPLRLRRRAAHGVGRRLVARCRPGGRS